MKPEPLKGKVELQINPEGFYYKEKDVRSAVEWFKQQLEGKFADDEIFKLIDQAFEDVVKTTKEKG